MKQNTYLLTLLLLLGSCLTLNAQQYAGMSGLLHVPSAEMNREGDARMGVHFINKQLMPIGFYEGAKIYHSFDYYLAITPFSWLELSYVCTLMQGKEHEGDIGNYDRKDRYFALKLRPLKEGKWWPAIAVGFNDFWDSRANLSGEGTELFFGNWYIAASKHIDLGGHELGAHLAYRDYRRDDNAHWEGVTGGLTYRPAFAKNWRLIAEYAGEDIHVGMDCLLWKHLLLQVSLQQGKYLSGGICYQLNLF